jgi:hypothetical protein
MLRAFVSNYRNRNGGPFLPGWPPLHNTEGKLTLNSIQEGSAPVKRKLDSAGERELLINALRMATARSRLITNTLETIGVSLRHKQVDCEGAMQWLKDEGLLDLIDFGPPSQKGVKP